MGVQPSVQTETYVPDRLIAGITQLVTEVNHTLASGQNLARGALVGRITANGQLTLSLAAAADGSQTPYGILADDFNASAGALSNVAVYVAGEFNERAVTFGTGHTAASTRIGLRDRGIFLKPSQAA